MAASSLGKPHGRMLIPLRKIYSGVADDAFTHFLELRAMEAHVPLGMSSRFLSMVESSWASF
jgi:hypothetical protein